MYLRHLTINGFKSFAKKGELEFTSAVTAIVGPNGSGKSNVAEAFRFVLGEQSNKGMRAKSGADLIFNGSEKVSRAGRAAVEVLLDNRERVFPLDFNEVKIERVVHRDGQNDYLVNGSKVRLKDVQEILAAANIGSTGHHIISQGEADRVLSASPKERREMIEDALGLKVFQYKKQEAEKKLVKTAENIEKVESLRREVAPHLKFLERQVKKMERSIELRNELSVAYQEYLKREEQHLETAARRLSRAATAPSEALESLQKELRSVEEALESEERPMANPRIAEVEAKLQKTQEEAAQLLRESGRIEGQVSFLEKRINEAGKEEGGDVQVSLAQVSRLIDSLDQSVQKAVQKDDVSLLKRALIDIVGICRTFIQKAGRQPAPSTEREERELKDLHSERQELTRRLETVRKNEEVLRSELHTLRQGDEARRIAGRERQHERFRLQTEIQNVERTLSQIEIETSALERDREAWREELQEAVALLGRDASRYRDFDMNAVATDEHRTKQLDRRRALEKLKIRLEETGGVDPEVEKEYTETKDRDEFLQKEITDLTASVEKLEQLIADLTKQLNLQFAEGIKKIDAEFGKFFTLMFGGGEAKLERVAIKSRGETEDEDAPVVEGLEVDVKLPNKRVRGLDMLSGGERALTSIALIFAMSQVNPPLFIILDETDAALDEANSRRYGDMIEALAKRSQLILITHNRETMSRAGVLYGVTMADDGVSKLLSVKLEQASVHAKA